MKLLDPLIKIWNMTHILSSVIIKERSKMFQNYYYCKLFECLLRLPKVYKTLKSIISGIVMCLTQMCPKFSIKEATIS